MSGIMVGFHSELHCKASVYLAYLTTYTDLIAVLPITLDRVVAVLLPIRFCFMVAFSFYSWKRERYSLIFATIWFCFNK